MHGLIHLALKKHLIARYGVASWTQMLELAGVSTTLSYERVGVYPDEELLAIVDTAARITRTSRADVLEDFGAFIAEDLIVMYPRLVRPEWRTLDLLCNTEQTIHEVVRRQSPGATPATLRCERVSPEEVRLTYASPRMLCDFARGIIRGVARHYGETVTVEQASCMLQGDPHCLLIIRHATAGP